MKTRNRNRHIIASIGFAALLSTTPGRNGAPEVIRGGSSAVPFEEASFSYLEAQIEAHRESFFIYKDGDSGFNHGFPSGFFGEFTRIELDPFCVDSAEAPDGCSQDPAAQDQERGNVLSIRFLPLNSYAGVNIQEPEHSPDEGTGYDLTGATELSFEARSPAPEKIQVQFGIGGAVTPFIELSQSWERFSINFSSLALGPEDLSSVHILFTVVTNRTHSPSGGVVLLDNIQVLPNPVSQRAALGLPLSLETHGVVPAINPARDDPIPEDQAQRNMARIEDAALSILLLLSRGDAESRQRAAELADALLYALEHDNQASPVPFQEPQLRAFHDAYSSGDLALFNDQLGGGKQGEVRLAGFTGGESFCAPTRFCLIADGTQLRSSALAAISLLAVYEESQSQRHLEAARKVAGWAVELLSDPDPNGFGGFFAGFGGQAMSRQRFDSKSTDGNALFFSFLTQLGRIEKRLGNEKTAQDLEAAASRAAEFVLSMFDPMKGCFNAGSLPVGTPAGAGLDPTGPQRGEEVANAFQSLESNTLAILALASSPGFSNRIDWLQPAQCLLDHFAQQVEAAGTSFSGFSPVLEPVPVQRHPQASPPGISWSATAQAVLAFQLLAQVHSDARLEGLAEFYLAELDKARLLAPFANGSGLVEATLQGGEALAPSAQCLSTPFACIPQRVGLGATAWGLLAHREQNPLNLFVELLLPFFLQSEETFTGLAVSNFSSSPSALEFTALSAKGEPLALPSNPARFDLMAGRQLGLLSEEAFGPSAAARKGWVRVTSNNPEVSGFLQFGDFGLNQLDGASGAFEQSSSFRLTRAFQGLDVFMNQDASTEIMVVNPNRDPISVGLVLHRLGSEPSPAVGRDIPGGGFLSETLDELFGDLEISAGNVEVQVVNGKGALGFELIRIGGRALLGLRGAAPECSRESFSAQLASGESIFTSLNLINTSDATRNLTLRSFDSEGTLSSSVSHSLQPNQQLTESADSILGLAEARTEFTGSLHLEADGPGVCGDVVFGDPDQLEFAAALPLQDQPFHEAVFSHVANVSGFFTGLALLNTGAEPSQVSLEIISAQGTPAGQATLEMAAGRRISRLLPELVPASAGQAGGYVRLRSSQPLIAQMLFGSVGPEGIRLLSAVPPRRVR